jgi:hypothetical protein
MLQGFTSLTVPAALAATLAAPAPAQARAPQALPNVHQIPALYTANAALLDDVSERSFRFFWDTANPANGIVPDRYPTPSFGSIAAVGFGLTAYTVGVDRGYITRPTACARVM